MKKIILLCYNKFRKDEKTNTNKELQAKIKNIKDKIYFFNNKTKESFVVDVEILKKLLLGDFSEEVYKSFWDTFRERYCFEELTPFFSSTHKLLERFYFECCLPSSLKFYRSTLIANEKKDKLINKLTSKKVTYIFMRNYHVIIMAAVIFLLLALIFRFKENQILFTVLSAVLTGFVVSLLIVFFNYRSSRFLRNIKKEIYLVTTIFEELKQKEGDVRLLSGNEIHCHKKKIIIFVDICNLIKYFISKTKYEIFFIGNIVYDEFLKLGDKIYKLLSEIIRKTYKQIDEGLTQDEKTKIQLYAIYLDKMLKLIQHEINETVYMYTGEINEQQDRKL